MKSLQIPSTPATHVTSRLVLFCQRVLLPAILLACLLTPRCSAGANEQEAPNAGDDATTAPVEVAAESAPLQAGVLQLIMWYQLIISPIDGDRCGMTPTCSHYAAQALREHGFPAGLSAAFERLMRDNGHLDPDRPAVLVAGRWRVWDPLSSNTIPHSGTAAACPPLRWPPQTTDNAR